MGERKEESGGCGKTQMVSDLVRVEGLKGFCGAYENTDKRKRVGHNRRTLQKGVTKMTG